MSIIIGADLVPTKTNEELFKNGDAEALVGKDLLDILNSADYRIFNLETPLTDDDSPIDKCGPALMAPTASINGYRALGVDLLTLANNHIMDQGVAGFDSTIKTLDDNGINHVGGGKNLEEAKQPFILDKEGKKIGIYACAEHEFSIADENAPGANPFDPLESLDHVAELKNQCDFVIVLYHGGKEHYRYPSPNLQKVCRKLVKKGADLVICQHSHCIGCEEKYQGGTIVYGQGNFLFDHSNSEFWQTSLLIEINDDFSVSYLPLVKKDNVVSLAIDDHAKVILEKFISRTEEIKVSNTVNIRYKEFAKNMKVSYLSTIGTFNTDNVFFRVINKISGYRYSRWIINRKYDKAKLLRIKNYIKCEAHRELFLAGVDTDEK